MILLKASKSYRCANVTRFFVAPYGNVHFFGTKRFPGWRGGDFWTASFCAIGFVNTMRARPRYVRSVAVTAVYTYLCIVHGMYGTHYYVFVQFDALDTFNAQQFAFLSWIYRTKTVACFRLFTCVLSARPYVHFGNHELTGTRKYKGFLNVTLFSVTFPKKWH